jgi:hypothetical protein
MKYVTTRYRYAHPSPEVMKSIFERLAALSQISRMRRGVMSAEEFSRNLWQLEGLIPDIAYKRAIVDLVCSDFPLDRQALGKYLQQTWFKKDREQRKAENRKFRERRAAVLMMCTEQWAEKKNISKDEAVKKFVPEHRVKAFEQSLKPSRIAGKQYRKKKEK